MQYFNDIISTIGNTPLIKLNKVITVDSLVLAKLKLLILEIQLKIEWL